MARDKRIYRRFRPGRFVVRLLLILAALAALLAVVFWFWFKSYIVYTDDGLYLDIPWLYDVRGVPEHTPAAPTEELPLSEEPEVPPDPSSSPILTPEIQGIPETAATGTPADGQQTPAP